VSHPDGSESGRIRLPPMCRPMNGTSAIAELESMCGGEDVHVESESVEDHEVEEEAPNWGPKTLKPHWVVVQRESVAKLPDG